MKLVFGNIDQINRLKREKVEIEHEEKRCDECDGEGTVIRDCFHCDGTGEEEVDCAECDGSGEVDDSERNRS